MFCTDWLSNFMAKNGVSHYPMFSAMFPAKTLAVACSVVKRLLKVQISQGPGPMVECRCQGT